MCESKTPLNYKRTNVKAASYATSLSTDSGSGVGSHWIRNVILGGFAYLVVDSIIKPGTAVGVFDKTLLYFVGSAILLPVYGLLTF